MKSSTISRKFGRDDRELGTSWVENYSRNYVTFFCRHFAYNSIQTDVSVKQSKVIKQIASTGNNCIIIDRSADMLLKGYQPFDIFVCGDMDVKIQPCSDENIEGEHLFTKELIQKIRVTRVRKREVFAPSPWGNRNPYHIPVHTSGWNMKKLSCAIAGFTEDWLRRNEQ